ncbi:hypothetical protein SH203_02302 [Brevundimonas sp. SH203]|uniref:hypothetical protein n=1 Tax=Brevundimonas sp. SH203 TaxID=345167 RepID=UPI0009CEDAC5|nr:hypothetical protein [Brevundimonas sp. SH203]GAW41891.1 hypothetical protein SH203_02302 [Brevundimonas sp. SH203]
MSLRATPVVLVSALTLSIAACGSPERSDAPAPPAAPAQVAPIAVPAATDWTSLNALVGQYPNASKLIEDSAVTADLKTLLGDKYETLRANMQTQAPLEREGSVLYTSGNKAHEGGINAAYMMIDPTQRAMEVGLWENGKLTTYSTQGSSLPKPKDIQTMIANG